MQIFIAEIIVHYHYLSLLQYSNKDCLLRPEDCLETVHKQFFLSAVSGVSVFCQQSIAFLFSYWLGIYIIDYQMLETFPTNTVNTRCAKKLWFLQTGQSLIAEAPVSPLSGVLSMSSELANFILAWQIQASNRTGLEQSSFDMKEIKFCETSIVCTKVEVAEIIILFHFDLSSCCCFKRDLF